MKALSTNITPYINAPQRRAAVLAELALDGVTLRYAANVANITFPRGSTVVYSARAFRVGDVQQTMEGSVQRIKLRLDNVDRLVSAYVNSFDFENRELVLKRIFFATTTNQCSTKSTEYEEIFRGKMERPKDLDRQWVPITATEGKPLKRAAITQNYERQCRYIFGSTANCGIDGNADLTVLKSSGYCKSGTAVSFRSSSTAANDYWNYGRVTIVTTENTYRRTISDFASSSSGFGIWTLDLATDITLSTKATFLVKKGCDKTWNTCGANNAWGPSADNTLNFGGFIHIEKDEEAV